MFAVGGPFRGGFEFPQSQEEAFQNLFAIFFPTHSLVTWWLHHVHYRHAKTNTSEMNYWHREHAENVGALLFLSDRLGDSMPCVPMRDRVCSMCARYIQTLPNPTPIRSVNLSEKCNLTNVTSNLTGAHNVSDPECTGTAAGRTAMSDSAYFNKNYIELLENATCSTSHCKSPR